ncbi:MAG: NTP transferase domain-containing protein [Polyangiaceae bacterium]|nr:NTP transferase domain-containing protein [Polyangiaceae bacterium]
MSARDGAAGAVLLAAGRSSRAGTAKALATLAGEPLVVRAARTLAAAGCAPIVVVTAAPHAAAIERALCGTPLGYVRNPDPDRGMLSSARLGVAALGGTARRRPVVLSLVDHPHVAASTIAALLGALRGGAAAARPTYAGRGGHPIALSAPAVAALLQADEHGTLREALRAGGPTLDVPVDDPGVAEDLDTPEALAAAGVTPGRGG